MKDTKINRFFTRLCADMASMTWTQRVDHIWSYYKESIVIVIALVLIAIYLFASIWKDQKELLLGGLAVNVTFSEEAQSYLQDGYTKTQEKENAEALLQMIHIAGFSEVQSSEQTYYMLTKTIAMLTNQEIDYFILDQTALELYLAQDAFLDLSDVFPEEELDAFGENVIQLTKVDEDNKTVVEAYPVALRITEIPFVREMGETTGDVYIAFAVNAPHSERLHGFWAYLNMW